jgi:hypothetical protein
VGGNSSYVGGDRIRIFDNGTELGEDDRRLSYQLSSFLTTGVEAAADIRHQLSLPDISVLDTIMDLTHPLELSPFAKRLTRFNMDVIYGGDWASPMRNISLLSHRHGYLNYEGGDCVFPDGFLQIPRALAFGMDIRYNSLVRNVSWSANGGASITTDDGTTYRGTQVLLTQSIG